MSNHNICFVEKQEKYLPMDVSAGCVTNIVDFDQILHFGILTPPP